QRILPDLNKLIGRSAQAQPIARTTPPSTRRAAPVVPDAGALQTKVMNAAISAGSSKRRNKELGRICRKNSFSTCAVLRPLAAARFAKNPTTPSEAVGPGRTLFTVTFVPARLSARPRATAICAVLVTP